MKKNVLFNILYWSIGIILICISFLLMYFGNLHLRLYGITEGTIFNTISGEVMFLVPGSIYLLGGKLVTSLVININLNGIIINNPPLEGFEIEGINIDYITCSFLLAGVLIFIISGFLKRFKISNFICGSLIALSGIALYFEPLSFAYFNQNNFSNLNQYIDDTNNTSLNYSNPCAMIAATIIVILGLLIIGLGVYQIKKNKNNNLSIKNEIIENKN